MNKRPGAIYSLEFLLETFTSHIEESERVHQTWIKSFIKNNPEKELPHWAKEDFCLPRAMASIDCMRNLKKHLM